MSVVNIFNPRFEVLFLFVEIYMTNTKSYEFN